MEEVREEVTKEFVEEIVHVLWLRSWRRYVRQEEVVRVAKEVWEAVKEIMDRCLRRWISRKMSNRRV